ncbi:MAG: phosphomannomutase [Alphaproteobacteria bacterium]|nr:phosphomannomutase [Alphaproteobacteria bacterium]
MTLATPAAAIAFGTSGLRGRATDFDAAGVSAHVTAFLDYVGAPRGGEIYVGCDLRSSSPTISALVLSAIAANGQVPHWCGVLPTPAVAAAALARRVPAIIVTGSHIPEDHNGIKFYRPDGELLKQDEAPIRALAEKAPAAGMPLSAAVLPDADASAGAAYVDRYAVAYGPKALKGLKLGVYEHSAAGRDLLADILVHLGAEIVRYGRSESFVAVDTEALEPESLAAAAAQIAAHGLDAVVSTDGDGDRPLLIDADGRQINGDVLCALAARALGIRTVVTPLTSTSAVELSGWFDTVIRTRIGSPHVVAAMQAETGTALAGFEANGGFLLGSDLALDMGRLAALPTRDAILPLVAVCAEAARRALPLAALVAELPGRVMKADRLKEVPGELSARFLSEIAVSAPLRSRLAAELERPRSTDTTDGVRFGLADGSIVHFRASGNAPELRAYVETDAAETTGAMLRAIMTRMDQVLSGWRNMTKSAV